jgi:hypothetical protein
MKCKVLGVSAVVFVTLLSAAWAADVTGKWVAQVPGRQGTNETTFNFKVDGDQLTGTVSSQMGDQPISEGKVSGDDISFVVTLSFGGNEIKLLYKGKVSGDEIKFTRERQGGGMGGPGGGAPGGGPGGGGGGGMGRGGQPQEFVAKRAS